MGYETSVHGLAGLGCADCHGGDSTSTDKDEAHAGVRENVRRNNIPAVCGECHEKDGEDGVMNNTDELMSRVNAIVGYKSLVEAEGDDPAALASIEESFERLTLHWHRFDFDQADAESLDLLGRLRGIRVKKTKEGE